MREQPGLPAAAALARVLARQQLLLVLDNCEHVAGAAAQLCAGMLAACDEVRVLATSREPLRVAGEARYRLGPLALPDPDDMAHAAGAEAVALFTDRARSADARFALTGETTPVVAGLVARLDGMPLAIELAAARVEALGVAGLLDRIGDRFALLTEGDRGAPDRHRSLAATVEWSYRLLEDRERRVFRAVSVFPGPFTLEAAEAVAGPGAGPAVLRLVDCSLLSPPQAGSDDRSRYVMLETLRAYGAGLSAGAGEQDEAEAALAGYALQVARQAAAGSQSGDGEHDKAVRLARQAGRITAGISGTLARMCSSVLTSALAGAGNLAEAARAGAAGLARARDAGDLWNQALLLSRIVDLDLRAGRTGDAAAHLREGLRIAVRTGNWLQLHAGLSQCGDLCAAAGRATEALTLWAVCAAVDQREGPTHYPPWFAPRWEDQMRRARQALGPGRARAAEDRGAAMSITTAAEYALMLTDPGPSDPAAPDPGTLSARERELVTLVARGRTNAEIAAELYISVRTVGSHLDRIRDKTGCRRRADLTRLALTTGLV